MIRIPSPYGLNGSDAYRGPLLFNPGGPGQRYAFLIFGLAAKSDSKYLQSGVEALLTETAQQLLERVGDVYDLVSFDPRGKRLRPGLRASAYSNTAF